MSISSHAGHFFQTSDTLAQNERKQKKSSNKLGDPVRFPTKLLSIEKASQTGRNSKRLLITEAGGVLSSFDVSNNSFAKIGSPASAPLTCVTSYYGLLRPGDDSYFEAVLTGGWDKSIVLTTFESDGSVTKQTAFRAHSDFIKCLLVARTPDGILVVISGGADNEVNIWNLQGQRLASLKPQSRGIESLILDPLSEPDEPRIFFSTSQREIYSFVLPSFQQLRSNKIQISDPIIEHETSVYKLFFDREGDLWTASADKTAKRLVRENGFRADTVFAHPDFVRDVVVYEPLNLVITACRDEEVRVWNCASGQLMHVFSGHYEEVTGLTLVGSDLFSISIDATLRKWSLAPQDLQTAIKAAAAAPDEQEEQSATNPFALTAEEEAELQALMEEEQGSSLDRMAHDEQ